MSKAPAFQFYASDFLSDLKVATMSMEERGVYITLLSYAWLESGLPDDIKKLARLCGNPKNFQKTWEVVGECFYIDEEDGRLKNTKMEEIRDNLQSFKKKMSDAGKKGMESRWKNNLVKTKLKQSYNSSSSTSTSTSSSNIKSKEKIDFIELMNKWNSICGHSLPQIKKLTESRKRAIRKIYVDYNIEEIEKIFLQVSNSDFLTGASEGREWKANFDWVMKEPNLVKISEGVYNNNKKADIEKIKNTPVICTNCNHKFITNVKLLHTVVCEECNEYGIISQHESLYM